MAARRVVLFQPRWLTENNLPNNGRCLLEIFLHPIAVHDIPQYSRQTGKIVVSCIFWSRRNEYYLSSVDLVYLIQSLFDLQLASIDKNRIRRNLEGLRPITVCKPSSALVSGTAVKRPSDEDEFYHQIMSYGEPKPRTLEKDIKMYKWNLIPTALAKVIQKYGGVNSLITIQ